MADIDRRLVHGFQGFQQGSFVVEGLACVSDEDRRDAQGVSYDKSRGGRIPSRVATGLERIADTAVRETGGVRLLLDQ